ncbi:MAG: hypothetical protein Q9200_006915 [Gallowayella weberi]
MESFIQPIAGKSRSPRNNNIERTPDLTSTHIDTDPPSHSPSPSPPTTCNVVTTTTTVATAPIDIPGRRRRDDLLAIKFPHLIKTGKYTISRRSFDGKRRGNGKRAWEKKALRESRERYEMEVKEPFEREIAEAMAWVDMW